MKTKNFNNIKNYCKNIWNRKSEKWLTSEELNESVRKVGKCKKLKLKENVKNIKSIIRKHKTPVQILLNQNCVCL